MNTLYLNGRVFDGDRIIDGHGVLVDGDRIARVAPAGDFEGFAGEVVDCTAGTVMPGLIDCHVHLMFRGEPDPWAVLEKLDAAHAVVRALEHARDTLLGGVTSVRDCGGRDFQEFAVRDACNEGRFQGPTILAAGKVICMTGGHGSRIGRVADGVDEVVKAVREQVHAGSDLVKIMATGGVMTPGVDPEDAHYSAEEMAAGITEAKRFRRRTASHAQGSEGILNATRGGVTSIEHGIFMNEECCREMLDRGTYLVPTLAALRNILDNEDAGIPDYVMEKAQRCAAAHERSIRMFDEAGGRIALGTDAGTPFNLHGDNAAELKFMVDVGMSNLDALRAGTRNGAELMGFDDRGRIAEGAVADLLVVDGDPSTEIEAAADRSRHLRVIKGGMVVVDRVGECENVRRKA
ncbi:MAG: amidohydrolase family protein [Gammaproteobacteria bacterium]|nr:amidohydrolase family protein [Gammaproteobacteria bacterium]